MKLRFFEDSKLQSQFITVEKTLDNQRPVQNPVKHLSWSLLQINCVYSEVHYFWKHFLVGASKGKCASGKSKEKLGALLFISQQIRTAISADSSTFKFSFILIANWIHVSFISNWFIQALEYWHITLSRHCLLGQTHHNNSRLVLSNFSGDCGEIQSKLHSIVLTLLQ